jgi:hypothetical protein
MININKYKNFLYDFKTLIKKYNILPAATGNIAYDFIDMADDEETLSSYLLTDDAFVLFATPDSMGFSEKDGYFYEFKPLRDIKKMDNDDKILVQNFNFNKRLGITMTEVQKNRLEFADVYYKCIKEIDNEFYFYNNKLDKIKVIDYLNTENEFEKMQKEIDEANNMS